MSNRILNLEMASQEFDDLLLRIAISSYMEIEGGELLARQKELDQAGLFQPTEEERRKILAIIRHIHLKRKILLAGKGFLRLSRCIPIAFTIGCVVLGSTMLVSAGFRDNIYRLVFQNEQQYTLVRVEHSLVDNPVQGVCPWKNGYLPYQLPKGYHLKETRDLKTLRAVVYANDMGKEIGVIQFLSKNVQIDDENADYTQTVLIHGQDALLVMKNGRISVTWENDGYILQLSTMESIETTLAVAQNTFRVYS